MAFRAAYSLKQLHNVLRPWFVFTWTYSYFKFIYVKNPLSPTMIFFPCAWVSGPLSKTSKQTKPLYIHESHAFLRKVHCFYQFILGVQTWNYLYKICLTASALTELLLLYDVYFAFMCKSSGQQLWSYETISNSLEAHDLYIDGFDLPQSLYNLFWPLANLGIRCYNLFPIYSLGTG